MNEPQDRVAAPTGDPPETFSSPRLALGLKVPMRDGIGLNANLYSPGDATGPFPAIVILTPYAAQYYHDRALFFARNGYAFLAVDVRGRGDSEGEFNFRNEGEDGFDAVEWAATQDFCDGRVLMCGGSYSGYVQWVTAGLKPPHLRGIVPVASPFRGVDSPARNNIFAMHRLQWLALLWARTTQDRVFNDRQFWRDLYYTQHLAGAPFCELDKALGMPSPIFQEWLEHPDWDDYWDSFNPTAAQYGAIDIPILSITGAYDADQLGSLAHYRAHLAHASAEASARHQLVIGPWDHAHCSVPAAEFAGIRIGPSGVLDVQQLHVDWFGWVLGNNPRPPLLEDRVTYYVTGAEEWCHAPSLGVLEERRTRLFLDGSEGPRPGSLSLQQPGESAPGCYAYDPRDLSLGLAESRIDEQDLTNQDLFSLKAGRQLLFESDPFGEIVEISGIARFSAWIAIDQPDTDFIVSLYEIDADGGNLFLTSDIKRARYRQSLRHAEPVATTEPLLYCFDGFTFVSRRLAKGSRLRLVFGPLDSIHFQRNRNSGKPVAQETNDDARTVNVKLFHEPGRESLLELPLA